MTAPLPQEKSNQNEEYWLSIGINLYIAKYRKPVF